MKKIILLIAMSIATHSLIAMQGPAAPVSAMQQQGPSARNVIIPGALGGVMGTVQASLQPYVQGGTPPYTFVLLDKPTNAHVQLSVNGNLSVQPTGYPVIFHWMVTDAQGYFSPPAEFKMDAGPMMTP